MKKYAGKIMKWALVPLVVVVMGIICITAWQPAQAALTMTTAIDTIDAWQAVVAGTLVDGTPDSISDSYSTILYIELVPIEDNVATDGAEVIVEISYADDLYIELVKLKATAETPLADDLDEGGGVTAGDTTITLTDESVGDLDVIGRRIFIYDTGAIANSEVVRVKSVNAGTNTLTLAQDVLNNHDDAETVHDRVDQWAIKIPFGAAYVRTIINNVDADHDYAFTTRISKVTALN